MNTKEAREEGKWMAQLHQAGSGRWVLPIDDPHWKTLLLQDTERRDQLKRLAQEGDEEAALEAAYLDGYLSMWD